MASGVVTRFAPSPTGFLHIGGARTALFNWLFARGRAGRFLLRIEDTDRARHNEAAVQAIIDGLSWLGLDWDEAPMSQYARRDRHAEVARDLLARGAAYRCFMTTDEIEQARRRAVETKTRFESPWRDAAGRSAPDRPFTIRFKAPREGETIVHDVVQGEVRFPNGALDDLIIVRSDGAPTYNLAVVVDDHDMAITHVIRGDDHLNNAARQQQIYAALGWSVPSFSHVPLIHGPDGAKLSKRHGALGVEAYRDQGYLPEALSNYLLRLGWSHGDDEIISRAQALEWFDIADIKRAPARLDLAKLDSVNAHYIRQLSDEAFVRTAAPFFKRNGIPLDEARIERLRRAASFLKERSPTLVAAVDAAGFLFVADPAGDSEKASARLRKPGAKETLGALRVALVGADWSSADALEQDLKRLSDDTKRPFGEIAPTLRAALTGDRAAPSLGQVLFALGQEESLARIDSAARL
jgi:glutamyl-tRNA synthetase